MTGSQGAELTHIISSTHCGQSGSSAIVPRHDSHVSCLNIECSRLRHQDLQTGGVTIKAPSEASASWGASSARGISGNCSTTHHSPPHIIVRNVRGATSCCISALTRFSSIQVSGPFRNIGTCAAISWASPETAMRTALSLHKSRPFAFNPPVPRRDDRPVRDRAVILIGVGPLAAAQQVDLDAVIFGPGGVFRII